MKKKIFCFINGGNVEMYHVDALSEDGHFVSGHLSSSIGWAKHDIGIDSSWKHDIYKQYYPEGFELVWVDDVHNHEGLQAAYKKYCDMGEEEYKKTYEEKMGTDDIRSNMPSVKVVCD